MSDSNQHSMSAEDAFQVLTEAVNAAGTLDYISGDDNVEYLRAKAALQSLQEQFEAWKFQTRRYAGAEVVRLIEAALSNPAKCRRKSDVLAEGMCACLPGDCYQDRDPASEPHEDKGFSEEKCLRCGWVMGQPPLNCQNDDTPHRFPSQEEAGTTRDDLWAFIVGQGLMDLWFRQHPPVSNQDRDPASEPERP